VAVCVQRLGFDAVALTAGTLSIGEVARRTGIRTSAIRFYESAGLLASPPRTNGRRCYGPDVLARLALIATAQRMGFTIHEISTLMHGFEPETPASVRWQALVARKLPEIEEQITRAQEMKRLLEEARQCGCLTLDACARLLGGEGLPKPPTGPP
jgi:MerR family transcriptional regulator, redox-sensitive transcriptional activator SoxR